MKLKKAAMFGLDARIALAIFGALSVISGAALYSAIHGAKATALLTEMQEVGKAWEQYYLDTGVDLEADLSACTVDCYYKIDSLINSSVKGWQGPYIPYSVRTQYTLEDANRVFSLLRLTSEVSWGGVVNWTVADCKSGRLCSIWVTIGGYNDDILFKKIDDDIDSGDGNDAGNFRWINAGASPWYYHSFYKYAPILNPN